MNTSKIRACVNNPRGREAVFAGCDARSEERCVVIPLKRQATQQRARKGASRRAKNDKPERPQRSLSDGFDALARNTLLRALRMRYGHSTWRASRWRRDRIRAWASETRLMRIVEAGSR